jgi:hypothetical protein
MRAMPGIEHAVVRREVVVNTMSSGDESLSQRLGGYDVVAAFMTDYVNRIRGPRFARFGGGRGTDKKLCDMWVR